MARYLSNAFSAGMLSESATVEFSFVSEEFARNWAIDAFTSCVGHADTAQLLTALLGVEVVMQRSSTTLHASDEMLVAQYNGPRLPEGAKSLPEGAKIRWILARIRHE